MFEFAHSLQRNDELIAVIVRKTCQMGRHQGLMPVLDPKSGFALYDLRWAVQ